MNDLEAWLTLWRTPGVGSAALTHLLAHYGDASAAVAAGPSAWQRAGIFPRGAEDLVNAPFPPDIEPDLRWLERDGNNVIRLGEPAYPERLAQVSGAPAVLFVKGDLDALSHPQLAIVGSRNPTRAGAQIAREFAAALASKGICVTSGLALGIDAAAHEGALAGGGLTIAVAGTGLDRVYPARHRALAERVAAQGALVSEFPVGVKARAEHFPRRNRIISGLSLGTLVVEAARQSGSLITARYAAKQGREVFAVPGSIHNPLTKGCHQLIREGAKLVETLDDILLELAGQLSAYLATEPVPTPHPAACPQSSEESTPLSVADPAHAALLRAVDFAPTPIDLIIERSGLTAEAVSSMLLIMELQGLVAAETGGCYTRLLPG